jgi:hypothetical protein
MKYGRSWIAFALVPLLFTACATGGAQGKKSEVTPQPELPVSVMVTNYNWSDVTVYAVQGGARSRLGTVVTNGTRTFTLPRSFSHIAGEIRLLADPIGPLGGFDSGPILLVPGQQVALSLMEQLPVSHVSYVPVIATGGGDPRS